MTPIQAAQEQLDAYNAHDLPRFLAVYADDVVVYRLPQSSARRRWKRCIGHGWHCRSYMPNW